MLDSAETISQSIDFKTINQQIALDFGLVDKTSILKMTLVALENCAGQTKYI